MVSFPVQRQQEHDMKNACMLLMAVESLVANPERIKEVRHLCKEDRTKLGDATCNAASEAFRRRFVGDGKGKYTPPWAPQG